MLVLFRYETLSRGEAVISPQQATDHFYLIIGGRGKVSVYNPDNGREYILFFLKPGDGFD